MRPSRRAAVNQLAARISASRPRYEKVGKALGIPWYVVGIIHSLEASGNFTRHLHNGDPLTARTTHVPAGRPKTGKPPFTWEQSAIDALRGPGARQLEGLEPSRHALQARGLQRLRLPRPPSGRALAVPLELLEPLHQGKVRRGRALLADGGLAAGGRRVAAQAAVRSEGDHVHPGPRVLQLANPPVTGPDVRRGAAAAGQEPVRSLRRGQGRRRVRRADRRRGAAGEVGARLSRPTRRDTTFGPQLKAFLSGKKPLPAAVQEAAGAAHEAGRLAAGDPQADRPVGAVGLQEQRPDRLLAERQRPARLSRQERLRAARDRLLGLRDPLLLVGRRAEPERGAAPTTHASPPSPARCSGTCARSRGSAVQPGDLVVWTPPGTGQHVCLVVAGGPDPMLVSHGDDSGPKKLRFSAEDAYQRSHGHGTAVWLSAF